MSRHRQKAEPPTLTLRARSRILFPYWSRSMRAQWVLARMKVDEVGTWRFPVGEKHVPATEVADFLRVLPAGPALEIVHSPRDHMHRAVLYGAQLIRGRR